MQRVTLIENPLEPASWELLEVEDVRAFIVERFPSRPSGLVIYSETVGQDHDVTPRSAAEVEALAGYDHLFVVIYPEGPTLLIAALVGILIAVLVTMFLMPSIPDANQQSTSPNNALAERRNRPRPNERIPDIFGQVRSIPDLIAVPYRVYDDHKELEIAFMCIGRGSYAIDDIRDGDTLIADISGASVAVYAPGTSPNSGEPAQIQIGAAIGDPVFNVTRLNEVNGQVLKAPNDTAVRSDNEITFKDGGIIEAAAGSGIDFTEFFEPGDEVDVGRASDTGGVSNQTAIFAAATATIAGGNKGFTFATFDPTTEFTAGQRIVIQNATWTNPTAPAGGDIAGSTINPDYPIYYREVQEPLE